MGRKISDICLKQGQRDTSSTSPPPPPRGFQPHIAKTYKNVRSASAPKLKVLIKKGLSLSRPASSFIASFLSMTAELQVNVPITKEFKIGI